jgi:class 3 adenylate cyclase
MGERLDAEAVRELMFGYFHEMRSAIERHGGTVEKFVGDAVTAVFGVPQAMRMTRYEHAKRPSRCSNACRLSIRSSNAVSRPTVGGYHESAKQPT